MISAPCGPASRRPHRAARASPTPGWDCVSGFGTPVLTPLIKDIDHGNTAPIQGR
jgi:hypothetical protein